VILVKDLQGLLTEFKRIGSPKANDLTFLEISGYPHYENVISNILAFFFQPNESHGLGTLFLEALLTLDNGGFPVLSNVDVEREFHTESNNRIDLVIKTDSHIIALENKLFGVPSNPFSDYADHMRKFAEGKAVLQFYLSLYPPGQEVDLAGFKPVSYNDFVNRIRICLGKYVLDANTKYLTFALEFLRTIENLEKGTRMNEEVFQILKEKGAIVTSLLKEVNNLKNEFRNTVKELGEMIQVENSKYPVKQWFWREGPELSDYLVHDIKVSDRLPIAIDTVLTTNGWEIQLLVRSGGDQLALEKLLVKLGVPYEKRERLIYSERFDYKEPLENVATHLQQIIYKICEIDD